MLLAEESAQYIVPKNSVPLGVPCTLCKENISESESELVLTTLSEAAGETHVSHSHIDCIQQLVKEVPSIYAEFEELRDTYLEGAT